MQGLGRLFNLLQPAEDDYVSLRDAGGVTFMIFEVDGDTSATITTAATAGGGSSATGDLVTEWFEASKDQSDGVWVRKTQAASETFSISNTTGDMAVVHISAAQLPDGHSWVKCGATGATVVAILHDLAVQRSPQNLRSVIA